MAQPAFPALPENLLRGGAGLFVFISRFFFHRVFYARFDYSQFIRKKNQGITHPIYSDFTFCSIDSYIGLVARRIVLAAKLTQYLVYLTQWLYPHWYIPFIFLTFLCSPLHLLYIRAHLSIQIIVFVAVSLIALLIHRPQSNSNFLQSLIYFTPYYLLGILFSQYQPQLHRWLWPLLVVSLLVIATTAIGQTYIWEHIGNYHKAAFVYDGWDLQFIQVLFGCVAMLALCRHIRPWLQQHLCWLADLSFPIFFIHPLLTIALENLVVIDVIKAFLPVSGLGTSLLVFITVFLVQFYGSVGIAVAIKRLAGTRSRWLIG